MSEFAVIPAIELRGGLALRYESVGVGTRATRVDPVALAREYATAGAPMLHVYNLDGPFLVGQAEHAGSVLAGAERNLTVVGEIVQASGLPVQLSGGVRDIESFKMVSQFGVARAAFGSAAMRDPSLVRAALDVNADAVAVFLDVRDGKPVSQDWLPGAKAGVAELAKAITDAGVKHFIYQDIAADAGGTGPRAEAAAEVAALNVDVLVCGGIESPMHIAAVAAIPGVNGVIVGRPLAMQTFSYKQALEAAQAGLAKRK